MSIREMSMRPHSGEATPQTAEAILELSIPDNEASGHLPMGRSSQAVLSENGVQDTFIMAIASPSQTTAR